MADPLGVSFSPTGDDGPTAKPSPVQQAIQTLSLRIPTHAGASAFTPQSLLSPMGGRGGPNDAILEFLRKLLFGQPGGGGSLAGGPMGAPPPGGIPPPGVTPGGGPLPRDPLPPHPPDPGPDAPPVPDPLTHSGPISTQPVPLPPDSGGPMNVLGGGPSESSFPLPTMRRGPGGNRV